MVARKGTRRPVFVCAAPIVTSMCHIGIFIIGGITPIWCNHIIIM